MGRYPRISIIIPVYNGKKYIAECLDSVLSQTYTDFEVVVVDDASNDGSKEILEIYSQKDSRVKVLHHDCNKGLSFSRHDGFSFSKGEWIAFMDHDDYIAPWAIEKLLEACLQDKVDISCIGGVNVPDDVFLKYSYNINKYQPNESCVILSGKEADMLYIKGDKRLGNISGPWGKLFKRSIVEGVLNISLDYKETIPWTYFEDTIINSLAIYNSDKVEFLYTKGYLHRVSLNSLSTKKEPSAWHIQVIMAVDFLLDYYKKYECYEQYNARLESLLAFSQSVYYRENRYGSEEKKVRLKYIEGIYEKYIKDYLNLRVHGVKFWAILLFYKSKSLWLLLVGNLYFRRIY